MVYKLFSLIEYLVVDMVRFLSGSLYVNLMTTRLEFDTVIKRRKIREGYEIEYIMIPKALRGNKSLAGKEAHVIIEVKD